ncbi:hypothetical protein F4813DRAFT_364910 [Daldinia decipiens]|uniref:uncharacterized protein n=1 Tax=Daldinia decipiens TaxID=326647 RepID=UPI0020C4FD3A|nr:uncharacterized protein F4813DRAFT_364910 [Daldinia decipiens]KAI1656279.1 hypothetical protein F4813DRAFT_364910 [Daldinia decipiens]
MLVVSQCICIFALRPKHGIGRTRLAAVSWLLAFGFRLWLLILLVFTSKPLSRSLVGQPEHYLYLMRLVNTDRLGAANVLLAGDPAGQVACGPGTWKHSRPILEVGRCRYDANGR